MTTNELLCASQAAARLGVSVKALRLYEQRGLLTPIRDGAGWRRYGAREMARASDIVALRALGLGLAQIASALAGEREHFERTLQAHQAMLEGQMRETADALGQIRRLRDALARAGGSAISSSPLQDNLSQRDREIVAEFALPWPWDGERFALRKPCALNYIVGPLGSGKTRLARTLAQVLRDAAYWGLDRLANESAHVRHRLQAEPILDARVERALDALEREGAERSPALRALCAALESDDSAAVVVDLVERDLTPATQKALMARLRRQGSSARPLFLMTRSCDILDLAAVGPDESIIHCPANHSPPIYVEPFPGIPGYEAIASCLAPSHVRARTQGMIAVFPRTARAAQLPAF